MLEVDDLHVYYGEIHALKGVSFRVLEGEIVTLLGNNGAGKTTTLKTVSGLLAPRDGAVLLDGGSLVGAAAHDIVGRGITHVPEGRRIFNRLTVAENLRLGAIDDGEDEGAVAEMLDRFPILRERAAEHADRLSGGEQQQLAIARALLGRPKLLILDEPSLGLAPKTIDMIYELLARLREEGTTMLLVEQNATRTIDFCDRCAVLGSGAIRARGSSDELRGDMDLVQAYMGRAG